MVTMRTAGRGNRIVAFFGSDLAPAKAQRFLARAHKKGYTLLALDSTGMSAAAMAEVPYVVLDDVLSPEDVYEAHVQADECGRNWFRAARDDFTVEGYCWPELEAGNLRYFWGNATLALKLAKTLASTGTQEFRFFRHVLPRAQVGYGKSDVCAALWEAELPGIARPLLTFEELQLSSVFAVARRTLERLISSGRSQSGGPVEGARPETGGIFLVMGGQEALRFSDVIQQLARCFPDTICVAAVGPCATGCETIRWKESVPVVQGPAYAIESWMPSPVIRWLSRRTAGLAARFWRGYTRSRDCAVGSPWQRPLEVLRFHFEYYCLYRWPRLQSHNMKFWSELWAKHRPRAVLASSIEDGRFRMVVAAAKGQGIRTIGIPHGGMVGAPGHLVRPVVDDILYSTELQKAAFERRSFPVSRMHACRDLVAPHEYRVVRSEAFVGDRRLRMLALTDTTDEGTNLVKFVGLRAQYTALKALVEAPADLSDEIEVRIKVHPNYHDLPMLEAVGPELMAKVMARDSDLHAALEETDLVAAVNYYGSALIHAFRRGKPVVQFLTVHDSLVNSRLNAFNLFLSGSAVARTADEFWSLVRSFLTDAGFARGLQRKAREFAHEHLDDSRFPPITELLVDLGFGGGASVGSVSDSPNHEPLLHS